MTFFERPANSYARTKFCVLRDLEFWDSIASRAEAYGHVMLANPTHCSIGSKLRAHRQCASVAKENAKNGSILLQADHEIVRYGRTQGTSSNASAQPYPPLLVLLARFCHAPLSEVAHVIDKYACMAQQQSALQCTVKQRLRIRVHPSTFHSPPPSHSGC